MDLLQIARSWAAFAEGDPHTKALMGQRLAICDLCPEKVQISKAGEILVLAINDEGSLFTCSLCKCPLAAKTAHPMNECPAKKWLKAGEQSYF